MASLKDEGVGSSLLVAEPAAGGSWLTRKLPFLRTRRGKVVTVIVVLLIIGGGLAGLAALPKKNDRSGSDGSSGVVADGITSDAHFYGESPPVYPARKS